MKVQYLGREATMVRLSPISEKSPIQPGEVFEVEDKTAIHLIASYRGTFVQAEVEEVVEPPVKRVSKRKTQELKSKELA
jgi:hypothetical protein